MSAAMICKLQNDIHKLPVYSIKEDRFNAFSHYVGAGLSVFFFGWAMCRALLNPSINKISAVIIYAFSMMLLYTMSGIYHTLKPGVFKALFRIFDHCTIFVLIAGCYSPFCLVTLWDMKAGRLIFFLQWALAIAGIILNYINVNAKPVKIFSMLCYVLMGWMVVIVFPTLLARLSQAALFWLALGGVAYTLGILFYATGKKKPIMHCVWHIFVLMGSIFQFICIVQVL